MLIRRVRDACDAPDVQCIGTSATMATEGDAAERQKQAVAEVATDAVRRRRSTPDRRDRRDPGPRAPTEHASPAEALRAAHQRARRRPRTTTTFAADPLATWIETTFGLEPRRGGADSRRRRRPPTVAAGGARSWPSRPAPTQAECATAIQRHAAGRVAGRQPGDRPAAVRVPAAPVPVQGRHRLRHARARGHPAHHRAPTRSPQPGRQREQGILLPLAFCRECGQEYLVGLASDTDDGRRYCGPPGRRRQRRRRAPTGYLYVSGDLPWPRDAGAR